MTTGALVATIAVAALAALAWLLARAWLTMRGTRLVTCPETRQPVAVELDVPHALGGALMGRPDFRLRDCTRWPEKKGCGQACLAEIEAAPEGCLVRHILGGWYAERSCVLCGRAIGPVQWHDHKPALKAVDGRLWEWGEVAPEQMPGVLAGAEPVCWNCMMAEWFRREHPELVVDRPRPDSTLPHVRS